MTLDTEDATYLQRHIDEFISNEEDEDDANIDDLDTTMDRTLNLNDIQEISVYDLDESVYEDDAADPPVEATLNQQVINLFGTKETRCGAHVIQLAVKDFLKGTRQKLLNRTKVKVKDVRNYIRKQPPGSVKIKQPVLSNDTRWSSSFYMVKTLTNYHKLFLNILSVPLKLLLYNFIFALFNRIA